MTCDDCGATLVEGVCPVCAYKSLLDPAPSEVGVVGRYALKQRLAAGGMGIVFKAEDPKLKRTVALKVIRGSTFASEGEVSRFMLEAEAAAGLDHPNIVPIYEVGIDDGQPFFTMKLIEGQSLAERLKALPDEKLEPSDAVSILEPIARSVHHAHQRGVLHRDLKPANILIDGEDKSWLSDFGLAKVANRDTGLTRSTDSLGTPNYMAPEVIRGGPNSVSTASDVWALGVMLWEVLCGAPPFSADSPVETIRRIAEHDLSRPSGVDRDLITLAQRCLEKDPARRPASAEVMAEELGRWSRGEPLEVRRVTAAERATKWVRRNPAWSALLTFTALALLIGGTTTFLSWRRAEHAVESLSGSLSASRAMELAHEARLQIDSDPQLALLLAAESIDECESTANLHEDPTVLGRAAETLYEVLGKVGGWDLSAADEISVGMTPPRDQVPVISPDGRWALTFLRDSEGGLSANVFDLHDSGGDAVRRWQIWDGLGSWAQNVATWTPDSRQIIAMDQKGEARLWEPFSEGDQTETPTHRELGNFTPRNGKLLRYQLLNDNTAVAAIGWIASRKELLLRTFRIAADGSSLEEIRSATVGAASKQGDRQRITRDGRWLIGTLDSRLVLADLKDASGPKLRAISGRANTPAPIALSADSRWLAVCATGRRCILYNLKAGSTDQIMESRWTIDLPFGAGGFKFSPDGETLIVSGNHREIFVIDTDREKSSESGMPGRLTWMEHGARQALTYSEDGEWLAIGVGGGLVQAWPRGHFAEGRPPLKFRGLPEYITSLQFSSDLRWLIATDQSGVCRVWPFPGGGAMPRLDPTPDMRIQDLAISPDRQWIAAACSDDDDRGILGEAFEKGLVGRVCIMPVDGIELRVIGNHRGGCNGVAFSRDGKWLASTGVDGVVQIWDLEKALANEDNRESLPRPAHRFSMREMAPKGHAFRVGRRLQLDFNPRGELYATSGCGVIMRWDLSAPIPADTFEILPLHSRSGPLSDVRVSEDGRWLAVGRAGSDRKPIEGSTQFGDMVLLYDISEPGTPKPVAELPANFDGQANIVFSSDGRWLAASSTWNKPPSVWDLSVDDIATSRRNAPVSSAWRTIGIAFSPDSQWLSIGTTSDQLHIWDWRNNHVRRVARGPGLGSAIWLDADTLLTSKAGGLASWDMNIARLQALARTVADRELSPAERQRFLGE